MNLGGAMFWAMDLDDFSGKKCNEGKFPLINTAKNVVNGGEAPTTRPPTTPSRPTTPTAPPTTTKATGQSNTAAFYCLNCSYNLRSFLLTLIYF